MEQPQSEHQPAEGARFGSVLVLGLGKSGTAVCDYCLDALASRRPTVSSLVVYAGEDSENNRKAARRCLDAGVPVVFGSEQVEGRFDTCVASPGISENSDFYRSAAAASTVVMSEPEFAFQLSPERWIGITGTNGKTTTTSLATHLLCSCGMPARSVGNIGAPCVAAVESRTPGDYLVAELSSFQLASAVTLSPRVGVLLNITPDHLAWHGSHEAYVAAKMKLFAHLKPDALAVVDLRDEGSARCAEQLLARGVRLLGIDTRPGVRTEGRAGVADGRLYVWLPSAQMPIDLARVSELQIKGEHNVANALAAAAAVLYCGADAESLSAALRTFAPLEHRIEPCGVVDGVSYYNDSKATNTDATLKALTAFDDRPLIVLLGGTDKGTDLTGLVDACARRCEAVVCFGAARERFLAAFEGCGIPVLEAEHLSDAVDVARAAAAPGDVVALSPACSSFDEFGGFVERGAYFKDKVRRLKGE